MDAISMDKGLENMRINVFRLCAGLKVLGNSMILLVATIVGVSYYAVVVLTWGPRLLHATLSLHFFLALALLLLFHLLLILLVWSYFMVAFTDPGGVPRDYGIGIEDPSLAATAYCTRCQNGKPPRSHHCSICQRCVLKMDHHCVWVVNCIGACNYKNITSIEVYEQKKRVQWKYDLGRKKNFEQVFGTKKGIWFFPLYSVEDIENIPALRGVEFQMLSDAQS